MSVKAFIPNKISNTTVLRFMEILRKIQVFAWRVRKKCNKRLDVNREYWEKKERSKYIESQNEYTEMMFGNSTMSYSGCEIIAVYNAIQYLSQFKEYLKNIDLPDLILEFEKNGMLLSGWFGTSPISIYRYIKKLGLDINVSIDEDCFEEIAEIADVCILTMYNDRMNIMSKVHTICITKENNKYIAHNTYGNGCVVGPCDTYSQLISLIHGGKTKGICLIGIHL